MNGLIVTTKTQSEYKFLYELLKKLNIQSSPLSDTDMEDLGMSVLMKKVGSFVRAGEVIAVVGDTGEYSTGPHLHFELWFDGTPVNPQNYMTF